MLDHICVILLSVVLINVLYFSTVLILLVSSSMFYMFACAHHILCSSVFEN
jgi:hypothetical protein